MYLVKKCEDVILGTEAIYSSTQEKAEAIADALNDFRERADDYRWHKKDARKKGYVDWWCVIKTDTWAVVPAWDVQPGEEHVGARGTGMLAELVDRAWAMTHGDAMFPTTTDGIPTRENLITIAKRNATTARRGDLKVGDCFVYLSAPYQRCISVDGGNFPRDLPRNWCISYQESAPQGSWVHRVPHWNATTEAPPPAPVTGPMADGLTAEECLRRFEGAMRTESLARTPGGMVSTHGEFALSEVQVELAREEWRRRHKAGVERLIEELRKAERQRFPVQQDDEP